jgi:hypothetical protein
MLGSSSSLMRMGFRVVAVPEPGTFVALAILMGGGIAWRRRQRF